MKHCSLVQYSNTSQYNTDYYLEFLQKIQFYSYFFEYEQKATLNFLFKSIILVKLSKLKMYFALDLCRILIQIWSFHYFHANVKKWCKISHILFSKEHLQVLGVFLRIIHFNWHPSIIAFSWLFELSMILISLFLLETPNILLNARSRITWYEFWF